MFLVFVDCYLRTADGNELFSIYTLSYSLIPLFILTRELHSKALLACEEVCGELQADGVEGAVAVRGQRGAAQLPQEDPSLLGPVPDSKHVVDLLRVVNQEVQTVEDKIQETLESMNQIQKQVCYQVG